MEEFGCIGLETNPNLLTNAVVTFVPPKKKPGKKQKHHPKEVTIHDRKVKSFCWGSDVSCDRKGVQVQEGARDPSYKVVITPANPI